MQGPIWRLSACAILALAVSNNPVRAAENPGAGWSESGEATWYGPRHQGKRTSSGETFDSFKLTAAHPTLPLGSYVRVTDQQTGHSVVVRVNDREPPHGVRCIDLSRAAAARLGMIGRGVADVVLAPATREEAVEVAEAPMGRHAENPIPRRGPRHRRRAHP